MAARVILAGGGTAGHLFPAIAVGERLAEVEGTTVLLVAADSDRRNAVLADSGLPSAFVLAKPFAYRLSWQLVPSLAALLRSSAWAIALLRRFRPTVVFGTGGYVMAPVMVAAAFMRIPRVVHICDAYPDRAGQLLSRGAQLVTLAFPSAATHLHGRATRVTGVPVRRQILSANRAHGQELLGLRPDKFTVLVTGGSQGARSLNEALLAALPTCSARLASRLFI